MRERRVPPHVWRFIAEWTATTLAVVHGRVLASRLHPGSIRARLRARRLRMKVPGARAVLVDDGWRVAVAVPGRSLRDAATTNLEIVTGALEDASLPYRVVDAADPGPSEVLVGADERGEIVEALSAATRSGPLYVATGRGHRFLDDRGTRPLRKLPNARPWVVYRPQVLAGGHVVGSSHGCVVRTGGDVEAGYVRSSREPVEAVAASHGAEFPVDVVYTWVDDGDPRWRLAYQDQLARLGGEAYHPEAANLSRFVNRDELRFSLRSLELRAAFVRHVFIVTAGHVPSWLDVDHPDVTLVHHDEILDPEWLPTFNSQAIEARLHHIPNLAEHYLYVNDDVFFGREVTAETFFASDGRVRFFPDETAPIPAGPASSRDKPVDAAAKNVRDLLEGALGIDVPSKVLHTAHPQRRSVLYDAEERFRDAFERTGRSRFRSPSDISVASCLSHYFALATGRAVRSQLDVEYVNVAGSWAGLQMAGLRTRRDPHVFCLNETDIDPRDRERVDSMVCRFLEASFPGPSRFEVNTGQPSVPA